MDNLFINGVTYPLNIVADIPHAFKGIRVPGSQMEHASGRFGEIFVQRILADHFQIVQTVYTTKEECSVRTSCNKRNFGVHICLKNNSDYYIDGLQRILIHEKEAHIFYKPFCRTLYLLKGEEYSKLDIVLPSNLLRSYAAFFPTLQNIMEGKRLQMSFAVHSRPIDLSFPLQQIVQSILTCRLDDPFRTLYLRIKIEEFLFSLLLRAEVSPGEIEMTEYDRRKWHEVKKFISDNFTEHYPISTIAKKFSTNTTTLKSGFHSAFGYGVFEFLVKLRMSKAIDLLQNKTFTINQVAEDIGYKNTAGFIKAFKKYFGHTPGNMRNLLP